MNSPTAGTTKLLFVLSNDYGELSNALYLLRGGAFAAILLMPERLYAANADGLAVPARRYRCLADVIAAVEQEKPDVVFLFSGYLYAINNIFGPENLEKLVAALRTRHCPVVTSDPFLGIMARIDDGTFSDRHPAKARLTGLFSQLFAILRDVPHLYPVDVGAATVRSVSFFNPNVVLDRFERSEQAEKLSRELGIASMQPAWLFVLSLEDYGCQAGFHGGTRFDELLIGRLWQTVAIGRRPVLVAPPPCIASLGNRGGLPETALLLPFCRHDRFTSLLIAAEYVFYWNIFSNSVLLRIVNHLPVFFLAEGHMVHAIELLFNAGMKHYYADSELPRVHAEQALAEEELARLARRQEQTLEPARSHFRRAATPLAMVAEILRSHTEN